MFVYHFSRTLSSLSLSGERKENNSNEEETTFARESERKPGRSADGSWSKAKARGESIFKGLVAGAGAWSSNAGRRASSLVGCFAVLFLIRCCYAKFLS